MTWSMRIKKMMKKIDPPTTAEPLYHSCGSQGQAHQNTTTFPIALLLSLSRRLRRITHPRLCRRQRDRRHRPRRGSNSSKKTTNHVSSGPSNSWSSTSTSSSSSLSSSPPHSSRKPVSHGNKSQVMYASYKDHELASSPTSTLCYSNGGRKGFSSSMGSMKRALFSGSRHGSGEVNKA
ncbi:uncharacterized protein LOC108832229 [Raphanus sativus]|uniref:Uncharacterized protein LOC108832229 n=1 Tax=Raphanus sativus TaxID=3726 RepID=A0A9W3DSL7_RAPSA|nr:uncharacterized protein LOC108832229 [Raphanus sativus]